MLSFKPTFSLSSFTFIKKFFSSSSLSAIRVVSSAYLRLFIFLLAILIPACASSSPAFLMKYSAARDGEAGRGRARKAGQDCGGEELDHCPDRHCRFPDPCQQRPAPAGCPEVGIESRDTSVARADAT